MLLIVSYILEFILISIANKHLHSLQNIRYAIVLISQLLHIQVSYTKVQKKTFKRVLLLP